MELDVTVRRDLPMPEAGASLRRRESGSATYPFRTLEVGECFTINRGTDPLEAKKIDHRLRSAAASAMKRTGSTFIVRVVPDNPNLIGVWRTQ